ncbi:unnamed protein product [Durusdinium trenchii]|uniref:Uncharacterized protein n=1 Tax=Durusdinium trenchii TaxID=1381693 RepID=A0ABP0LUC5_9DINO
MLNVTAVASVVAHPPQSTDGAVRSVTCTCGVQGWKYCTLCMLFDLWEERSRDLWSETSIQALPKIIGCSFWDACRRLEDKSCPSNCRPWKEEVSQSRLLRMYTWVKRTTSGSCPRDIAATKTRRC